VLSKHPELAFVTYNAGRSSRRSHDEEELGSLLEFLNGQQYNICFRYHYTMDPATTEPVSSHLEQLLFMSDIQIKWAQQFCSSFMVEIDITFNINSHRLPLTILTGISNTGHSFPLVFSFVLSESKICFDFIFESLMELAWDKYPSLAVIIRDQAKGLAASLSNSMLDSIGQYCKWHAFENIRKLLLDKSYSKEQ
jgi:hypothetical protein